MPTHCVTCLKKWLLLGSGKLKTTGDAKTTKKRKAPEAKTQGEEAMHAIFVQYAPEYALLEWQDWKEANTEVMLAAPLHLASLLKYSF